MHNYTVTLGTRQYKTQGTDTEFICPICSSLVTISREFGISGPSTCKKCDNTYTVSRASK